MDFDTYYTRALKFLSYRPRSEKEIQDYLIRKKAPESIILHIVAELKKHKFLDDVIFTQWWIEQRTSIRKKSLRVIKQELKQKGIPLSIIEQLLQDPKVYVLSDVERARELAEKKIERYKGLDKREFFQKVGSFLARQGFDYDTIKEAINSIMEKRI